MTFQCFIALLTEFMNILSGICLFIKISDIKEENITWCRRKLKWFYVNAILTVKDFEKCLFMNDILFIKFCC